MVWSSSLAMLGDRALHRAKCAGGRHGKIARNCNNEIVPAAAVRVAGRFKKALVQAGGTKEAGLKQTFRSSQNFHEKYCTDPCQDRGKDQKTEARVRRCRRMTLAKNAAQGGAMAVGGSRRGTNKTPQPRAANGCKLTL